MKADIGKEEEVKKLVSNILDKYGQIHILVNVVGGYLGGKSVYELDEKEWDLMMNMNLKSAFSNEQKCYTTNGIFKIWKDNTCIF